MVVTFVVVYVVDLKTDRLNAKPTFRNQRSDIHCFLKVAELNVDTKITVVVSIKFAWSSRKNIAKDFAVFANLVLVSQRGDFPEFSFECACVRQSPSPSFECPARLEPPPIER